MDKNVGAARQTKENIHPSQSSYKKGCRCDECKEVQKLKMRKFRNKNCEIE